MRQVMDFYFTLQESLSRDNVDWEVVRRAISATGMKKFASAMLWIMCEVFEMENARSAGTDACLRKNIRIAPNERLGRFLLN